MDRTARFCRLVTRVVVLLVCLAAREAHAHQAVASFIDITCHDNALDLRVSIDPHVTPLATHIDRDGDDKMTSDEVESESKALRALILGRTEARGYSGACTATDAPRDAYASDVGMWQVEQRYQCQDPCAQVTVALSFFDTLPAQHRLIVRQNDGERFVTHTLQRPNVVVPRLERVAWRDRLDLVKLGAEHILEGWDHLAFVVGLVLAASGLRQAMVVLTAFTVAHSLTLFFTALGWIHLPTRLVEGAIGLSIAVVALANLWRRAGSTKRNAAIAFVFGLVHGMGFASALGSIFDGADLLPSLLGFNVGVELAQALVVLALWPIVSRFQTRGRLVANSILVILALYKMTQLAN